MNIERQFAARTPVGAYDRAGVGTSDAPARAPRTLPGLDLTTEDDIGGPGALAFDATHVTFDVTGLRVRAAVLTCSLLLLAALFPAVAPAASIPGQGLFDECPLGTIKETWQDCINNMPALRAAGYTHVLNANAGPGSDAEPVSDNIRAYADAAAANGVGIIWHIGSRNTINDTTDHNAASRAFISEMRSHPATLGYYIADEPPAENEVIVEAWAQEIERIDPNHPTFIVSSGWDADSWRSAAAPFWDVGNGIDYLGGDVYPIRGENPDLLSVKKVIGAVGEQARASGKQPWAILQAFPWSEVWPCGGPYVSSDEDYLAEGWCKLVELDRWPTRNEMLTMRDYALEGHPAMITWFIWSTMREEAHQRGIDWRDYGPWLDLQAVINAPYTPRTTPRDTTTTSRSSSRSSSRAALRLSTRPLKQVVKVAGKASVRVRVRDTATVTAKAVKVTVGHPAKTTYVGASRKAKRTGSRVRIPLGEIAAGRAKTVTARFKVKPIARGKLRFKVAVRAANAKTKHASAEITVK